MTEGARSWGFVAPALLWTVAFFLVPFAVMTTMSLARFEGPELVRGLDSGNYARLTEPALARAVAVSLVIKLTVTAASVLLAYPLAAIIAFRVPPRGRDSLCCERAPHLRLLPHLPPQEAPEATTRLAADPANLSVFPEGAS